MIIIIAWDPLDHLSFIIFLFLFAGRATDWLPAEQVFANTAFGSTSYSGVSCFDCLEE